MFQVIGKVLWFYLLVCCAGIVAAQASPAYYLRHTFATRMTSAGVSPLTIAQMLGHSSSQIVPRYAQVLDQNRLDAMKRLEILRRSVVPSELPSRQKEDAVPADHEIHQTSAVQPRDFLWLPDQ